MRKTMEQKPIAAAQPLDPPTPDMARAYLDEAAAVGQRREERVDRRALARVSLIESFVLAGYLTTMMFGFGTPAASSSFIVLVGLLLLWVQLTGELRESYGFQPRLRFQQGWGRIVVLVIIAGIVLSGVALQLGGLTMPSTLRFVPGVLVIAVFGTIALRDLRRAGPASPSRSRAPLSASARVATAIIGVAVGVTIWVTATADALVVSWFAMVMMFGVLGWWIAMQVSTRLPALGASWRWPHWGAFLVGWGVLAVLVLLRPHAGVVPVPIAAVAAVAVAAVSVATTFLDGRDAG